MNVLHLLVSADAGGIETLCRDYAKYSRNHNVFVVLWGKDGENARAIKRNGGKVIELNAKKREVISTCLRLRQIARRFRIDAVIVHHEAPILHIYMRLLKLCFRNLKTIAYAHCMAEDMVRIRDRRGLLIRKQIYQNSMRKSDAVIAISKAVKNSLIRFLNIPEEKITVIYNGTDTSRFHPETDRKMTEPYRLVYIGRLTKEKGVQTALKALERSDLSEKYSWTFDIVGDGPYRNELEQLTDRLNLQKRVRFLGNRPDIPALLNDHDIFVHMPEWEEGFGIAVIEAMAAGKLCICLKKGGIPEMITDQKDGFLVRSADELGTLLTRIFSDPENPHIDEIRNNAVKKAKTFDIRVYADRLDHFIGFLNVK